MLSIFESCSQSCCDNPFLQSDLKNGAHTCLSCQKTFKINHAYECPKCHQQTSSLLALDLVDENGNCDWLECGLCGAEYREKESKTITTMVWL